MAVGQLPSVRSSQQQMLQAALSSTSSLPDGQAAGPSSTDDNEQSTLDARQGDLLQCLAPGAGITQGKGTSTPWLGVIIDWADDINDAA